MGDLKAKAAYIRGLFEGMDLTPNSKEKILWEGMINFCNEVADNLQEIEETNEEFGEYIEAVDEDLSILEKYFYNNNEEMDDASEAGFSNDEHDTVIELECPKCKEELYFTDEAGDYEVICPECGETVWSHFVENDHLNGKTDVI